MRVTASKVGLLSYCQWWARPEAVWSDRTGPSADRGTRFHAAMHRLALGKLDGVVAGGERGPCAGPAGTTSWTFGSLSAVDDDIREAFGHAAMWFEAITNGGLVSFMREIAFAWDPETDTAEQLTLEGRDYSEARGRLCGTADLVLWHPESESASVYDYKTGDGSGAGPQLRTLGLMVARALHIEQVTVAALECRDSGVTEVAREELDAFALAAHAGELAEHIAAIDTAEPQPGSHCGELYCPARLSCPLGTEATAEVVQVIPAESLVRRADYRITDPVDTADKAIWSLDVLRLMGAWIESKKDEIKAFVPPEGITTEDGRTLRETTKKVEAFDKHKALALCKQLGATEAQIASLHYTFQQSNGLRVSGGSAKPRAKRTRAA